MQRVCFCSSRELPLLESSLLEKQVATISAQLPSVHACHWTNCSTHPLTTQQHDYNISNYMICMHTLCMCICPCSQAGPGESVSQGGSLDSFVLVQGSLQPSPTSTGTQPPLENSEGRFTHLSRWQAVVPHSLSLSSSQAVRDWNTQTFRWCNPPPYSHKITHFPPPLSNTPISRLQRSSSHCFTYSHLPPSFHISYQVAHNHSFPLFSLQDLSPAAVLSVSSERPPPLEPVVTVATGAAAYREGVPVQPIPEYTFKEESRETRTWRHVHVGGEDTTINMSLIQPYRKIIQHAGGH